MSKRELPRTQRNQAPAPPEEAAPAARGAKRWLLPLLGMLCAGIVVLWIINPFSRPARPAPDREELRTSSPPPVPPPPAPPQDKPATQSLKRETLEVARQLVAEFPGDADSHGLMGTTCSAFGQQAEAVAWYQRALELNPNLAHACVKMAEAATNQGEFELAAERYRRALEIDPDLDRANGRLGKALVELGRPEEAIAALKTELRHHPDNAWFGLQLGQAHMQLKQYEEAIPHLEEVIRRIPEFRQPYYVLARAYARLGQRDKAARFSETFRQMRDAEVEAIREEIQTKDRDQERLLKVAYRAHLAAGEIYVKKGLPQKAEEHLRRAIQLSATDTHCRKFLFNLYMRHKKWPEALDVCRELLRIDPGNPVYYQNQGAAQFYLGQLDESEKAIRQSLRLAPRSPQGYHSLVQVLGHHDWKLPEAKVAAEILVELQPTARNYEILAELCRKTGDLEGARAALQQARQVDPRGM